MNELKFVQIEKDNRKHFEDAKSVWLPFIKEVNTHDGISKSDEEIIDGLRKRIAIQGKRSDMHFEVMAVAEKVIGIAMFAIDLGTVYGLLETGYGTIMGFYIKPEYRRQGYGRKFYQHIEKTLRNDGAKHMYLCPDSVTGMPFWTAMGFYSSGKFDPDDKKPIYVKEIAFTDFDNCNLQALTKKTAAKISQWEYEKPFDVYNFKGHPNGYLLDQPTWGVEQFCLMNGDTVIGFVSCQLDEKDLWVGWSLAPSLCGKSNGSLFVTKCVREIRKIKQYNSDIFLRVAASNQRAIKAYQKAGFVYVKTIQDEVAYTNHIEDFWVMAHQK